MSSEGAFRYASFHRHQIGSQIVDIFVFVFREQLAVSFHRVVNFDFGYVAIAADRALRSIAVHQRHDEIIDPQEPAFNLFSAGRGDGDGDRLEVRRTTATPTAARQQKVILKLLGIRETRAYAFEISRYRMAGGAGGFEVRFALGRVAYQDARRNVAGSVVACHSETVNVGRYISN